MRPNLVDRIIKDFVGAVSAKRWGFGGYAPVKQVPSGTKRAAAAALFVPRAVVTLLVAVVSCFK